MSFVLRAFRCVRPVWFRPSAIAVGWLLAQLLEHRLRTGRWHSPTTVAPVTLLEGLLLSAGLGAIAFLAWDEWNHRRRHPRPKHVPLGDDYVPRTVSIFCDPTHERFDHARCDGHINRPYGLRFDCHCDCHRS